MYLQFVVYHFQSGFGVLIDCIDISLYHSGLVAAKKWIIFTTLKRMKSNCSSSCTHQPRTFNPPLVFGCFFCTPPCSVFPPPVPPAPPPPPPPFPCFPYFPPFCCTGAALTSVVLLLNSTG